MNQPTLISSAELEALPSRPDGQDSALSPSPKSTITPHEFSHTIGRTSQMSETSQDGEIGQTLDLFPSLPAAFLVSRFPSPGSEEAREMSASSGRQCATLLSDTSPLGCVVRTCLESLEWNSTTCLLIWKASAIGCNRLLFQLAPWTQDIDETEFGFWPTPTVMSAMEANHAQIVTTATGFRALSRQGVNGSVSLQSLVKLLPTPCDCASGKLNPVWVEWLMGYPIGWTACEDSVTPSSRKSRSKSSSR